MSEKLTKAQRRELAVLPDAPKNVGGHWKASRVFLALYDADLAAMFQRSRNDVSCGPGYHGSDWFIHRTPAGRAALSKDEGGNS